MSTRTSPSDFDAMLTDAWERKTDNLSLRNNLYAILQANWPTFTAEQTTIVRSYIEAIDRWILESGRRQSTNGSTVPKHCVRCHASYVEGDLNDPCIIPHVVDDMKPEMIANRVRFQSKCCGRRGIAAFKLTEGSIAYQSVGPLKNCYEGTHTTNVGAVEYWRRQNPGCNGTSLFPCQIMDGNCVRTAVRFTEGMFVQAGDFGIRRS